MVSHRFIDALYPSLTPKVGTIVPTNKKGSIDTGSVARFLVAILGYIGAFKSYGKPFLSKTRTFRRLPFL
jgi:hypothetical protein